MADIVFHEVERGATFATFQGPTCVLRGDWSNGVVRSIFVGHIEAGCAQACIQFWQAGLRTAPKIMLLQDFWDATGYDTPWRTGTTDYAKKQADKFIGAHILSRSKILNMGVSVAALAAPSWVVKSYGKRVDFDLVAKQAGLPLNPPMPQLLTVKQS
jgi:hypothetical protein